ncbi:transcription factor of the MADS box [Paramarasmius palmivorus]|uniref:Transcription factor of the MADS box n=1 Tax=Paramarasmius palmivorus TaxID=297713 RepID=A0AAW0DYU8_9AGAR
MRKRQRMDSLNPGQPDPQSHQVPPLGDDAFINDHDAVDSGADDDEDDEKPKSDKKAGRRKIKIEFIQDKSRRHITFSKRKAVVSETGLVYTFTTAKLQPLVTQPEGKNLIQACLNAPHGTLPSTMPVGAPLGRAANVGPPSGPPPASNIPGGLSISGQSGGGVKEDDDAGADDDDAVAVHGGRASTGDKRRRASSNATAPTAPNSRGSAQTPTSPHSANASIPPPLSIPTGSTASPTSAHPQQPQINLGSPTSPQQAHNSVPPPSGSYSQSYPPQPHQDGSMYGATQHMVGGYSYGHSGQPQGQLGGLANAAAAQHWQQPTQQQVGQNTHYSRR